MSESEWKPLIYTRDDEGDYMRWNGRIFPDHVAQCVFDVLLQNGTIHYGCLVRARGVDQAYAHAITQDGEVIALQHKDLLRPAIVSIEALEAIRTVAFNFCVAENRAKRKTELESRKSKLRAELAEINAELTKLKKEASE